MGLAGNRRCCCRSEEQRTELRHFSRRDLNPRPPSWQAGTALYRSNSDLHHRQADAVAPAVDGYAGEQAISAFSDDNAGPSLRVDLRRAACVPFPRPHPGACVKGGRHTRIALRRSIRHLHHQRRLSREDRGKPSYKNSFRGAVDAPHVANLWVRSAIGVRLIASFPPAGPAHLGARLSSASPEIRVSRSGHGRDVRWSRASGNKKPSGAAGSGGSVRSGRSILRSGKIAPMSRACAIE